MAVLCIAGSGSGSGKTAVGCELIRAIPEFRWLAVKVSPHLHDVPDEVTEEKDAASQKDTGRYLAAGARRAFLVTSTDDALGLTRQIRLRALGCDAALIETGKFSAAALAGPGEECLTLVVLAGQIANWKPGTLRLVRGADALVLPDGMDRQELPGDVRQMLSFALPMGEWKSEALVDFVRERFRLGCPPRT